MIKTLKKIKITFIILIFLLFIIMLFTVGIIYDKKDLKYGITFSKSHAESLNLPWKETFILILDELNAKNFRLSAYWNEIESEENKFNYKDLDWLIEEASKRNAQIILAIGLRLPRWPECHLPSWAEKLEEQKREEKILNYLEKTIERYKDNKNIYAWQIENEPFLPNFGECPQFNVNFLDKEIALAKKIDSRPIVITDSGELSLWVPAAKRADIFGTSIYLHTYSNGLKKYIHYPISPKFFNFKKNVSKLFANPKDWIVIELQAEPWGPVAYQNLSEKEKGITMDMEKFREIIKFSHEAGFKTFYLWGAEWWYWEKIKNNNPAYWEEAKRIFNSKF